MQFGVINIDTYLGENMSSQKGKSEVQDLLASIISREVVPTLLRRVQDSKKNNVFAGLTPEFDECRVDDFCALLSYGDRVQVFRQFDMYLAEGYTVKNLFLDLVIKSARRLGTMWEVDDCSFADVTIGMNVLHDLLRVYTPRLSHELEKIDFKGKLLLFPIPGDDHIFGMMMLESFMLASGLDVRAYVNHTAGEMLDACEHEDISFVAISLAVQRDVEKCRNIISDIRSRSLNRDVRIVIGGRPVDLDGTLVEKVGANAQASSVIEALEVVERLCIGRMQFA